MCRRAKGATRHGLAIMHAAQGLLVEVEWLGRGPGSSCLGGQMRLDGRPVHSPAQVFIQRLHSAEERR